LERNLPNLTYLIPFDDLAARRESLERVHGRSGVVEGAQGVYRKARPDLQRDSGGVVQGHAVLAGALTFGPGERQVGGEERQRLGFDPFRDAVDVVPS